MQRKLSLWAMQEPATKFGDLYHLLYNRDWLQTAHEHVKRNAGSNTPGYDGITMKDFDANDEQHLAALAKALKAAEYAPLPVKRAYVPKKDGTKRPLGIPAIKDRIVQEALRMILEPIFEADFSQHSYGFRPNRCTMDAVGYLGLRLTGSGGKTYNWVIEGDIKSYFAAIHHRKLMRCIQRRIKDKKILDLIWKFLRAGVMEERQYQETLAGTPQGGVVSPLLANIYLHALDRYMESYTELPPHVKVKRRKAGQANFLYARYADDFAILCNGSKAQAEDMRTELKEFLARHLRLELSMEKTKVTHIHDGFTFLGFWIERSVGQYGRRVPKIRIPDEALTKIRHKVLEALAPSTTNHSLNTKIQALNRVIGGWCRYYQYTSSPSFAFKKLGCEVFWKMAHWLGRKYKVSIPRVLEKFYRNGTYRTKTSTLKMPTEYKAKRYKVSVQPNPYVSQPGEPNRDTLTYENVVTMRLSWTGYEGERAGSADTRPEVYEHKGQHCKSCGKPLQLKEAEIDHKKPRAQFKQPKQADTWMNLQVLCKPCHARKTKVDRQVLSRMR